MLHSIVFFGITIMALCPVFVYDIYAQTPNPSVITELLQPVSENLGWTSDTTRCSDINANTTMTFSNANSFYRDFYSSSYPNSHKCYTTYGVYQSDPNLARGYDIISIKAGNYSATTSYMRLYFGFYPSTDLFNSAEAVAHYKSSTYRTPLIAYTGSSTETNLSETNLATNSTKQVVMDSKVSSGGQFLLGFGGNYHFGGTRCSGTAYEDRCRTVTGQMRMYPYLEIQYAAPSVNSTITSLASGSIYGARVPDDGTACPTLPAGYDTAQTYISMGRGSQCAVALYQYEHDTPIPAASITRAWAKVTIDQSFPWTQTCYLNIVPSNSSLAQTYSESRGTTNQFSCFSPGEKIIPLPVNQLKQIWATQGVAPSLTVAPIAGFFNNNQTVTLDSTAELLVEHPTLRVEMISDLRSSSTDENSITLTWSPPNPLGNTLSSYEIFRSTDGVSWRPISTVPLSNSPTFVDSDVTADLTYQYYVVTHTTTIPSLPSNIVYANTLDNFRIGQVGVELESAERANVLFSSIESENSTSVSLSYVSGYNITCAYATTSNNTQIPIQVNPATEGDRKLATFSFSNLQNTGVQLFCSDQFDNDYNFVVKQDTPPILQQFQDFQNHTFGTSGDIGIIDLSFMGIVILSMIGFSRRNPVVGIMTSVVILFVATWLGFIEIESTIVTVIILVIVAAVISTRKT